MTGHGQAHQNFNGVQVWAEVRAVNNRYLKVTVSYQDRVAELESNVKAVVQKHIRRGSVHVNLELQREQPAARLKINTALLKSLHEQVQQVDPQARVESLLTLPGVVEDHSLTGSISNTESSEGGNSKSEGTKSDWDYLEPVLQSAMENLVQMRRREGVSLTSDLLANCRQISEQLDGIEKRAPQVASDYSTRLTDRINGMLADHDVSVSPSDVIREVGIFADKCDISEEIVRLHAHIDQFSQIVNSGQSDGRKLEFLSQEMLRETNTIGSKANDSLIAQGVVEIKTAIDRIREMTQNVE